MDTLKISGKDYSIKPTYGKFQRIFRKYDFGELEKLSPKAQNDMIVDSYWCFMMRRWFGLKPFIFKRNFANNILMDELREMSSNLPKLLTGEDRNLGNSD